MVDLVFPDGVEPRYYPNTTIFENLLNISSAEEFHSKEAGFTAIRSIELLQKPDLIAHNIFDFECLKAIHKYLFQDLYLWAGKPRSYDMHKDGSIFTPANELPKYENQAFERSIEFAKKTQRPSLPEAANSLASCLGIINTYHPFPEGNGRTQRIFISLLANVFKYSINWNAVHIWEIIETSKQVHNGNYEPLENLIKRIIVDENSS